jgi:hypothetical protein
VTLNSRREVRQENLYLSTKDLILEEAKRAAVSGEAS